jgi:hypothetical protein
MAFASIVVEIDTWSARAVDRKHQSTAVLAQHPVAYQYGVETTARRYLQIGCLTIWADVGVT